MNTLIRTIPFCWITRWCTIIHQYQLIEFFHPLLPFHLIVMSFLPLRSQTLYNPFLNIVFVYLWSMNCLNRWVLMVRWVYTLVIFWRLFFNWRLQLRQRRINLSGWHLSYIIRLTLLRLLINRLLKLHGSRYVVLREHHEYRNKVLLTRYNQRCMKRLLHEWRLAIANTKMRLRRIWSCSILKRLSVVVLYLRSLFLKRRPLLLQWLLRYIWWVLIGLWMTRKRGRCSFIKLVIISTWICWRHHRRWTIKSWGHSLRSTWRILTTRRHRLILGCKWIVSLINNILILGCPIRCNRHSP